MVAVEAVVRDEHHGRIRPGELHEALEEEVVQAVGAIHHIAIHFKVGLGDALHARRVVGHELVADLIHRPIVNGHEVPLGVGLHEMRGGIVRGEGLGELLSEHPQAFILRLVYLWGIGHKKPDHFVGIDLMRAQAQVIHRLRQVGRPVGAGRRRRPLGGILILLGAAEVAEHIRHHLAIEMLLALRRKPTHDMAAQTALTKHFPERAALTRGRGDRHHRATSRVHLGETRHAVVIRHLARGDRGPEHRRELRLERGEIPTHPALDQTRHAGQSARIEKRVDDFPIRRISANEEEFFSQEVFCALQEKDAWLDDLGNRLALPLLGLAAVECHTCRAEGEEGNGRGLGHCGRSCCDGDTCGAFVSAGVDLECVGCTSPSHLQPAEVPLSCFEPHVAACSEIGGFSRRSLKSTVAAHYPIGRGTNGLV